MSPFVFRVGLPIILSVFGPILCNSAPVRKGDGVEY